MVTPAKSISKYFDIRSGGPGEMLAAAGTLRCGVVLEIVVVIILE
jgi:hypothetical protein